MTTFRTLGRYSKLCALVVSFLLLASAALHAAPQESRYRVLRTIKLGGEGGWDYVTVDPDARRVYIPRGTHIMVVDEESGKLLDDITA
jgi:hypothetical protein